MVELDPNGCRFDRVRIGREESVVVLVCEHILPGTMVCVRNRDEAIRLHRGLRSLYVGVQPECVQVDEGTSGNDNV